MQRAAVLLAVLAAGGLFGFLASEHFSVSREVARLADRVAALEGARGAQPGRPTAARERPTTEVYSVSADGAPLRGNPEAAVTIVEFSDFQCPYCGRAQPTLRRLLEEYGGDVRLAFKHLPLSFHPDAPLAHRASLAAERQGRFWEMHDRIFEHQRDLKRETLIAHAQALGLDVGRFQRDLDDPALEDVVDRDLAEAQTLGITGTPTFFINGRLLSGARPYADFRSEVERELSRPRS